MLMETIDDLGGADALENIFEELEEDGGGL